MAVLSFAQLLHGSRYIGQCRLSPSMPFILILEGKEIDTDMTRSVIQIRIHFFQVY